VKILASVRIALRALRVNRLRSALRDERTERPSQALEIQQQLSAEHS